MKKEVLISGGGTAGHIFPAIAVAQEMTKKDPELHFTFVGSSRNLEKLIMTHYGADFISLKIGGLKGKGISAVKTLFLLPLSFMKSLVLLLRIKPLLSIGVGGYSSGPVVFLSSLLGFPTLIMEQNVRPGLTNRLLSRHVKKAVVSFEESLPYFRKKGVLLGNPVRKEFLSIAPKKRTGFLSLLIFGGSQGSRFLNKAITSALPYLEKEKENLRIKHQTGEHDFKWVKNEYEQQGFNKVQIQPFFFDMAEHFQNADLVICRSGATTIAELIAARKASLLIPFSKATDDHQLLNAKQLQQIEGAEILEENAFTPSFLADTIRRFIKDKKSLDRMEQRLKIFRKEDAALKISELCFKLISEKHRRN